MKFKSKYLSLTVYSGGKALEFKNGELETIDKSEIRTLKHAADVEEVTETKE